LKLKDEYQDAIIWYYLEGYSVSEIAKILDKSEPATRMLISRAIKNLRQEYDKLVQKI
jgi:RNA polymerase sigma factor (sigma-70 family)